MKLRMTLVEKHELYAKHLSEPNVSKSALALWAAQAPDKAKRTKEQRVALPEVEVKLVEWVLRCEELGLAVQIPKKKGRTSKVQHGEAGSVPRKAVDVGCREVLSMTAGYSSKNVLNMDETSFLYCMSPHRSFTCNRMPGTKKSKKRITVALTTNAAGTDTIDPLFIGTAARPRCFGGQTPAELGFDYYASKKGWMNSDIFNSYLEALNVKMAEQGRKVLMLVDIASPHPMFETAPCPTSVSRSCHQI
ncbi:hypothetical protein DYB32_005029 [Aphanomyces invadans]|uniref:DDE-1 domain-containing protein n=1 Tax=Aphanomyces invadans TaxID=157072 RepID=A0A418AVU0_9STRA|nr:hypothetical protein DYB32_005029 [Aphanomyces invadans]